MLCRMVLMQKKKRKGTVPVYLNVYDLTPMNGYAYWLGLGVYHSGVQGGFLFLLFYFYLFFIFIKNCFFFFNIYVGLCLGAEKVRENEKLGFVTANWGLGVYWDFNCYILFQIFCFGFKLRSVGLGILINWVWLWYLGSGVLDCFIVWVLGKRKSSLNCD